MKRLLLLFTIVFIALPSSARRLRVAFVGDPQVDNETELSYARKSIYKELRERKDLDLIVILGDLVNDDVRLFVPSKATLDSLPCPWVCAPGNHDRDMYGKKKGRIVSFDGTVNDDKVRDMASFTRIIGSPDTSFVLGGIKFIVMDDVRLLGKAGYEGGFREDQKAWLKDELGKTTADMKAVLSVHIPFWEFEAKDSLQAILGTHPNLLLMCGHTHTTARHILDLGGGLQLEEVLAGATCGTFWRGKPDHMGIPYSVMNCGSPRGYYIADFDSKGNYKLSFKRVGMDEPAAAWITPEGRLIVNIYGGRTDGTLQVKTKGGKWTAVPRHEEPAPEVMQVIGEQRQKPRSERRGTGYIPLRTADSPHIWAKSGFNGLEAGQSIKLRYNDPSMKFSVKTSCKAYTPPTK